ncbi:Spy/CpxP family protein refolding chaperone [Planctomycetota bacterium]
MDLITQRRMGTWAIFVLVLLNLLVVSTLWWTQLHQPPLPPPVEEDIDPNTGEHLPPDPLPFMVYELGLSATQQRTLHALRQETLPEIYRLGQGILRLRQRMHRSIFDKGADPNDARALANRLGVMQAEMDWLIYEHFQAIESVCTPKQRQRLQKLISEMEMRERIPGRPRRGRQGSGRGAPGRDGLGGPGGPGNGRGRGRSGFGPYGPEDSPPPSPGDGPMYP